MEEETTIVAGINVDDIAKGKTKVAKIINIVQTYNTTVMRLLKICLAKLPNSAELNSIKRLILMTIRNDPDFMIKMSYKRFTNEEVAHAVCERDMNFFMNKDYNDDIEKSKNSKIFRTLLGVIKDNFPKWSEEERDHIWELSYILVHCSSLYNIII